MNFQILVRKCYGLLRIQLLFLGYLYDGQLKLCWKESFPLCFVPEFVWSHWGIMKPKVDQGIPILYVIYYIT